MGQGIGCSEAWGEFERAGEEAGILVGGNVWWWVRLHGIGVEYMLE